MATRTRTLRLERGERVQGVCLLRSRLSIDVNGAAPGEAQWFSMRHSQNIEAEICNSDASKMRVINGEKLWSLQRETLMELSMNTPSTEANDGKVTLAYYGKGTDTPIDKAGVYLTGVEVSLDVDADRDGVVEKNNPHKASWTWGPKGQGAILLVNCDKDSPTSRKMAGDRKIVLEQKDLEGMSRMLLRTRGPEKLPNGYHLLLHVTAPDSDKLRVFLYQNKTYTHVLGSSKLHYRMRYTGVNETEFFVEGLHFPDEGFPGLVSVSVSLLETTIEAIPEAPIYTDVVTFRMSPLIITPNTLEPVEVFVCSVKDNYLFLKEIKSLVRGAHYKISICFEYVNRGDRWMQDEMEFGYIQSPHQSYPVVLDSPPNGALEHFPIKQLLDADLGYVTKVGTCSEVSSLDSFGNLEVSPPVTVNGKEYPLGRLIIGSSFPTTDGRRMAKVVRDFLYAQQVQAPIELYTDWLLVGHVDEFMTFVPAADRKGFRLLLASPLACFQLFQEKKKEGHGDAAMFQGLETKRYTISKILSTDSLEQENIYVQRCLDWNRDILKQELGLTEEDIIDIPALFMLEKNEKNGKTVNGQAMNGKAVAFFPNMVNMIVLGNELGIPKPFGPIIKESCCLEDKIRSLLQPLELTCTFINDIVSYHQKLGEVHCGTNIRRKPFAYKWWHMIP